MTVQNHRPVKLDQSNVIINQDWSVVVWMCDNFGDIADLLGTICINIKAIPVTKSNTIIGRFNEPGDTVGSCEDPVRFDIVPIVQTHLPRPGTVNRVLTTNNSTMCDD